ncbi:hypothetical protein D7030_07550 [Flavobacteriaceae bacterium AU392]|nr:hypothetical protein D1817_00870 [Flavobacteriaceae bacterium]RKM84977.1 hypothetical protein D7030_07550 [Flavobacteriaceae bacterium AU392]
MKVLVIAFSKNLKEIYNIVHNQYGLYTDYYQLYRNFKSSTFFLVEVNGVKYFFKKDFTNNK